MATADTTGTPQSSLEGSNPSTPTGAASSGEGFAGGKVILLGEHSVVYGHPALAAGLTSGVRAVATRTDQEEDTLSLPQWQLHLTARDAENESLSTDSRELARAFAAAVHAYPTDRVRLAVAADVQIPSGAGLGCSAALGVAVMAAMDEALHVKRSRADLAKASLVWEQVFHGTPSGVDNTIAAVGGVIIFERGRPFVRVPSAKRLALVVAHSGEPKRTKAMVDGVRHLYARDPERIRKVFEGIASAVRNGRHAIASGDLHALGQLMDLNQMMLGSLMVSTPRLESLCATARANGALGAKLTGAGGGGCMIALAGDDESAHRLLACLKNEAENAWLVHAGE